MIQENYWSFYTSEPFRITHFNMRHPVFWYQNTKRQNNLTSWFGAGDCYLYIMANNFHNFLFWRPGSQQVWPPYATATRALCQKRSRCVLLLVLCPYSTYRRKWLAAAIFGECSALESSFATSYFGTIHILRKHLYGGRGIENSNFCLFSVHKICFRKEGRGGFKKGWKFAYVLYEWFLSYLRGCANATAFQPQLLAAATH
jgi:hypothetical protein